nr:hypothetical protein [Tanacetum cinerariifolium]
MMKKKDEDELVKTLSNNFDDKAKVTDKAEGHEDEEIDYTTSQIYNDMDIWLNEPVQADDETIQKEGTDAELTNLQQGNENSEISQVIKDAYKKKLLNSKRTILKKTQVTAIVDEHLDVRLGAIRDEFMNFLSVSTTARIIEIDKVLDLDKTLLSTYDKVYSLKRSQKYKDKDKDPSAGSDWRLKKRKTSKDAEPTKGPKAKESQSGSSKGTKSQPKSFGKSVQSEEPEFEVAGSNMPQDQEENPSNDDKEPKGKNDGKTPQQGPTQSWLMTLASSADKPSKTFDELMITPIDFSVFIMNGLKITNVTQETLLGLAFRLLKGTHSNYPELEYEFKECYKSLLEKLD